MKSCRIKNSNVKEVVWEDSISSQSVEKFCVNVMEVMGKISVSFPKYG